LIVLSKNQKKQIEREKMSVNLDAIRQKLNELSGQTYKKRNGSFWRPEIGSHLVRLLPFADNDGQPFKERYFYYDIGSGPGILAPSKFGKPDPIDEFMQKLQQDKGKDSWELIKKLRPKMRAYAPLIVRGEEDKGPRLWAFGKKVYQDLLNVFVDSDYGDVSNVNEGFDLKVTVVHAQGRMFPDTSVQPKPRPSKLHTDDDEIKKWLDAIPDLDEFFKLESYDNIKQRLDEWASAAAGTDNEAGTELIDGNNGSSGGSSSTSSEPLPVKRQEDIDAAFADLMKA